jgi:hypothetical protein
VLKRREVEVSEVGPDCPGLRASQPRSWSACKLVLTHDDTSGRVVVAGMVAAAPGHSGYN